MGRAALPLLVVVVVVVVGLSTLASCRSPARESSGAADAPAPAPARAPVDAAPDATPGADTDAATALEIGQRKLWAGQGDPAAYGCTLSDDGTMECSDPKTGRSRTFAVAPSVAVATISAAVTREAACVTPPPEEPRRPPGTTPVGSLSDRRRSVPLCRPEAALADLRALERTTAKGAGR